MCSATLGARGKRGCCEEQREYDKAPHGHSLRSVSGNRACHERLDAGGLGIAQSCQKFAVVVAERGGGQKVGAIGEGLGERGLATPAANGEVISAVQGGGNGDSAELGRAGVVRVVEQTAGRVGGAGNGAPLWFIPPLRGRSLDCALLHPNEQRRSWTPVRARLGMTILWGG